MKIGAQLFTVRNFAKDLDAFAETLKKVADIGYRVVQVSGTCAYDPVWLREELRKNGLTCAITHNPSAVLKGGPTALAARHDVFGCRYVGLGWYDFEHKSTSDFLAEYLPVAKALHAAGKQMMFHNHRFEFAKEDGTFKLYRLAEALAPELLGFTFDTYWAQFGGCDVYDVIERLHGRIPCVHFKDMDCDRRMMAIGEGNMNFEKIAVACMDAGTEYALVEQDDCNGLDPFDCLAQSYRYLRAIGLEA